MATPLALVAALSGLLADAAPASPLNCRVAGAQAERTLWLAPVRGIGLRRELADEVGAEIRRALVTTRCFAVQDAAQMQEVLQAQKRNTSDACDESCIVENGRLLQVRYVITGSVFADRTTMTIRVDLTDVQSGVVVASEPTSLSSAELPVLLDAAQELGLRVALLPGKATTKTTTFREGRVVRERAEDVELPSGEEFIVRFESKPPGAVVRVDGTLLCQSTPCSKSVAVGVHEVAMEKERYEPAISQSMLSKGSRVALELKATFGWLSVETEPPGLVVSINGEPHGTSPLADVELAPGGYEILARSRCYASEGEQVLVRKNEHRQIQIAPTMRSAGLRVIARDESENDVEAAIVVDGEEIGRTPYVGKVPLCSRSLIVSAEGGRAARADWI